MKKPSFVLDSFALLAYFQAEPSALSVKEILKRGQNEEAEVFLSAVNLGEILYTVERRLGQDASHEILQDVLALPLQVIEATLDRVIAAAHIKASVPIAYADAFAAALAQEMTATVVTGDAEFKRVESLVDVLWL